jgi:uncharacterized protein (TIGR03382 family)
MAASEMAGGNGLCGGDSGGGAYVLGGATPIVIGALSRASDFGSTCSDSVFARTDAHAAFLVAGGKEAAIAGAYTPPSWVGVVTSPTEDGGKIAEPKSGEAGSEEETTDPDAPGASTITTTTGCSASPAYGATSYGWAIALATVLLRRRRGTTTRR